MGRQHNKKFRRPFTLIEILIAVAILMLMMGFLFQFTAGAQRIWAVSAARSSQSSQASTFFNCLRQDFQSLVYGETQDEYGYYAFLDGTDLYFLIQTDPYGDSLKVVKYSYDSTKQVIYRQEALRSHADCERVDAVSAGWFNVTETPDDDCVVAQNVKDFRYFGASGNLFTAGADGNLPSAVFLGVSLTTTVPESLKSSNIQPDGTVTNELTFSRIFRIDGMQMQ